jgi:hypothetical protein
MAAECGNAHARELLDPEPLGVMGPQSCDRFGDAMVGGT